MKVTIFGVKHLVAVASASLPLPLPDCDCFFSSLITLCSANYEQQKAAGETINSINMETELAMAWTGQVLQLPLPLSGPSESASSCQQWQSTFAVLQCQSSNDLLLQLQPFFSASFGKWTAQSFLITAKSNWISLDILASLIYEGARKRGGAASSFQLTPLAVALLQLHAHTHTDRERDTCVCPNCARLCQCLCEMGARVRDSCTVPPLLIFFPLSCSASCTLYFTGSDRAHVVAIN